MERFPGIDGLPVDFYKCLWSVVRGDLLAVLSDSLTRGCLPLSCRRAVLTLLPKKGDLQLIKNWSVIALLWLQAPLQGAGHQAEQGDGAAGSA